METDDKGPRSSLIGLGAGGHAKVLIDAAHSTGAYEVLGLLDANPALIGTTVLGVPVLGGDDMLPRVWREHSMTAFFVGVGGVGDSGPRRRLFELGVRTGIQPATIVHASATVSSSATVGPGCAILAAAVVGASVRLGANCIVNSAAVVEHDCVIGAHAHIAPNASLAGSVAVGEAAHVGIGASILGGIVIGSKAVVGAGAVVTNDVEEGTTVVGCPARVLASSSEKN